MNYIFFNDCECYLIMYGIENRCNEVKHAMTPASIVPTLRDIDGWFCQICALLLHRTISMW